jgi:hypothetical protein
MLSKTSTASGAIPVRAASTRSGPLGVASKAHSRRLATLALLAIVAAEIVGCSTYPEVARENLRSVEHWQAYE